jgi:hypothetical protein
MEGRNKTDNRWAKEGNGEERGGNLIVDESPSRFGVYLEHSLAKAMQKKTKANSGE